MMTPEEILTECFRESGKKHGFSRVSAEFAEFTDLKIKWARNPRSAHFEISDYLLDAPEEVIRSTSDFLFGKIVGENPKYPEILKSWVTRPEFCAQNRPVYLERNGSLTHSAVGDSKDLVRAYGRLVEDGLVPPKMDVNLSWSLDRSIVNPAFSSVLMRSASISVSLDSDDVPDYVLDWFLYNALCNILIGFEPDGRKHRSKMEALLGCYSRRDAAEAWVDEKEKELMGKMGNDSSDEDIRWGDDTNGGCGN